MPTKIKHKALSVFSASSRWNSSTFHNAEAVVRKQERSLREESERVEMGAYDDRHKLPAVEDDAPPGVSFGMSHSSLFL